MNDTVNISRRSFINRAAAAASSLPLATIADPVRAGITGPLDPSPIPQMVAAYNEASDTFMMANDLRDDLEMQVAATIKADKASYEVRWPTPGPFPERRLLEPGLPKPDWRTALASSTAKLHSLVGRTLFGEPASTHTRIDEEARKAAAHNETAEAAFDALMQTSGVEQAELAFLSASEALTNARWDLLEYRPRSIAEAAEKAAAILNLGIVECGLDSDECEALLRSFRSTLR